MREWQGEVPFVYCCSRLPVWAIRRCRGECLNLRYCSCLATAPLEVENKTVRPRMHLKEIALAVLGLCLASGACRLPAFAQSATPPIAKSKPAPPPEDRIDINHASAEELLKVPGITATWAGRIIRYRPYRTKQDLLDRGVLPSDLYGRIKDYVIAHRDKQ